MLSQQLAPVLDIYPWPNGLGFENSVYWWDYVHRQNESEKLDLLLTAALLSEEISRLLLTHDDELLRSFALEDELVAQPPTPAFRFRNNFTSVGKWNSAIFFEPSRRTPDESRHPQFSGG